MTDWPAGGASVRLYSLKFLISLTAILTSNAGPFSLLSSSYFLINMNVKPYLQKYMRGLVKQPQFHTGLAVLPCA